MLDGVAITFSEEALRAVQDGFPIYEVILPEHATIATLSGSCETRRYTHCKELGDLASFRNGGSGMVSMPPILTSTILEDTLLA